MTKRVLIVEDNAAVMAYLEQTLTKNGYTVTTAINGLDGFNKAQKQDFDLCIVDHLMPLMNGLQFVKNMQTLSTTNSPKLIFLSTQDMAVVMQHPELKLVDKVLSKPISETDLLANVSAVLAEQLATA